LNTFERYFAPESQTSVTTRRRQQRARRRAGQDAFRPQQLARGRKALRVGNRIGLAHQRQVGIRWDEILADTLDRPAADLAHPAGLDIGRQHRTSRVGQDHRGLGRGLAHEAPDPGQHAAGADADHYGVDVAVHLPQQFRPGAGLVGARVRRIGELVDEDRARRAARDRLRHVLVVVGMALADVGAGGDHLGTHRLRMQHLLARHLVRHHQHRAVAFAAAHQCEAEPGIAGGGLDDGAAGLKPPVGLRRLDHRPRRPVLERAGGVGAFELEEQPADAAVDARHLHQRSIADQIEDGGHGRL
jgi:hypothetical protein